MKIDESGKGFSFDEWWTLYGTKHVHQKHRQKNQTTNVAPITFPYQNIRAHVCTKFTIHKAKW